MLFLVSSSSAANVYSIQQNVSIKFSNFTWFIFRGKSTAANCAGIPQVMLSVEELMSFDHFESSNFKSSNNIFIGYQTKLQLQKVDDPSTVQKFMVEVIAFYTNAVSAIKKRMPISNRVLKLTSLLKY